MIIGVAGAIGQDLAQACTERYHQDAVIACCRSTPLPSSVASGVVQEFGVDVRDIDSLRRVVARYAATLRVVWNLAAPLSVDTARDPAAAWETTVGGMQRLLRVLEEHGLRAQVRVCFSDSIGSFGESAPREGASARWLVERESQDPGSDYGQQKKEIRALLRGFQGDTRWAVIPGVLHGKPAWGGGTTEYALDAIAHALRQEGREQQADCEEAVISEGDSHAFACKVPLDVRLPMIYQSDLIDGLMRLMAAPRAALAEPEAGYALAGLSFSARELFGELQKRFPGFRFEEKLDGVASRFARLSPDSLSPIEAQRDLDFVAQIDSLSQIIQLILTEQQQLQKE